MLKLTTRDDLQRLIDDEIQESLTLDYKASPALAKDSKSRDELCKDVSAFANSAGGQIIYGIEEKIGNQ
jgi:predicted HTH transcriptional regulator